MPKRRTAALISVLLFSSCATLLAAEPKPRARDLGVPFDGKPGPLNAITDVKGVEVGHTTLISGEGALKVGTGPVRTGVTAVLPRGKNIQDQVFAGWFTLNGNGEMTGTTWVEESGFLEGPVMITNTHSVGVVRDAVIAWRVKHGPPDEDSYWWSLPVVAETWDGYLNDVNGFHVKPEHVFHALDSAHSGPVEEGNVGGGTGMVCNEFKGGIGTASRVLNTKQGGYTVGVLVQTNFGGVLTINGAPVGRELGQYYLKEQLDPPQRGQRDTRATDRADGSIIIIVATDAPLDSRNLDRLAARAMLGLARTGSPSTNGSGDYVIAFSTAAGNRIRSSGTIQQAATLGNEMMSPLFLAVVEATEEAIYNSLFRATTVTGIDGHRSEALPIQRTVEILKRNGALQGK